MASLARGGAEDREPGPAQLAPVGVAAEPAERVALSEHQEQ